MLEPRDVPLLEHLLTEIGVIVAHAPDVATVLTKALCLTELARPARRGNVGCRNSLHASVGAQTRVSHHPYKRYLRRMWVEFFLVNHAVWPHLYASCAVVIGAIMGGGFGAVEGGIGGSLFLDHSGRDVASMGGGSGCISIGMSSSGSSSNTEWSLARRSVLYISRRNATRCAS